MFALIIWSTIFMLKKRFLLSALLYCAAVLTKQMAIFYSGVYVGYLLVHYVIEDNKIHWLRLFKLIGVVTGSITVAFLPFFGGI